MVRRLDDGTMVLYHFTSVRHLPSILQDGFLRPTESNVSMLKPHAGPDVVWLTDFASPRNERGLDGSGVDKTEVRFTLDCAPIHWFDWVPQASMERRWRDTLIETGGGMKAATHWWVWPGRLFAKNWVEVHVKGQLYISRDGESVEDRYRKRAAKAKARGSKYVDEDA